MPSEAYDKLLEAIAFYENIMAQFTAGELFEALLIAAKAHAEMLKDMQDHPVHQSELESLRAQLGQSIKAHQIAIKHFNEQVTKLTEAEAQNAAIVEVYEACKGDVQVCDRCGHETDWLTDSNMDYAWKALEPTTGQSLLERHANEVAELKADNAELYDAVLTFHTEYYIMSPSRCYHCGRHEGHEPNCIVAKDHPGSALMEELDKLREEVTVRKENYEANCEWVKHLIDEGLITACDTHKRECYLSATVEIEKGLVELKAKDAEIERLKKFFPRCGDHVFHRPSGEEWLVGFADYKKNQLKPLGWPDSLAEATDCYITKQCTKAECVEAVKDLISRKWKYANILSELYPDAVRAALNPPEKREGG